MRQGAIGLKTREAPDGSDWRLAVDKTVFSLQESRLLFSKRESSELTMYIHMFAFRFKAGVTEEQKKHVLDEIRKLQHEIPAVLECWVGKNISPRSGAN